MAPAPAGGSSGRTRQRQTLGSAGRLSAHEYPPAFRQELCTALTTTSLVDCSAAIAFNSSAGVCGASTIMLQVSDNFRRSSRWCRSLGFQCGCHRDRSEKSDRCPESCSSACQGDIPAGGFSVLDRGPTDVSNPNAEVAGADRVRLGFFEDVQHIRPDLEPSPRKIEAFGARNLNELKHTAKKIARPHQVLGDDRHMIEMRSAKSA